MKAALVLIRRDQIIGIHLKHQASNLTVLCQEISEVQIQVFNMFNALNRFISRLDSDAPQQRSDHGAFGFQVLRNKTIELAIEPWFDFIVGINGRLIDDSDPALFAQEIRNCAGSTVTLGLWSAKVRFQYEMKSTSNLT